MEYFLQLFGDLRVGWVVVVVGALVFIRGSYKKVEKFFSDKTISEKENSDRIQKVIEQAEHYPKWRQQSIDIQEKLKGSIEGLGEKLDDVSHAIGENHASTCRYRILRFDDEIRHDDKHTKEHFDQILEDITEYERYCEDHPEYENNKAVMAINNIKRVYQICAEEGRFL